MLRRDSERENGSDERLDFNSAAPATSYPLVRHLRSFERFFSQARPAQTSLPIWSVKVSNESPALLLHFDMLLQYKTN